MPYSSTAEIPNYVPKDKRAQWLAVFNSVWEKNKDKSKAERERLAFSEANGVAGPHAKQKFTKLLQKTIEDDAKAFADEVLKILEEDFAALPAEVRNSLETSGLSGAGHGMLQIDVGNASLLAEANDAAREYAVDRAAELVGMKYDEDGELVENPDARWAISETTREKIRTIISNSFKKNTDMDKIRAAIQKALRAEKSNGGIFSEERAAMIARTEVTRAQIFANFNVWQKSGVVKKVRWIGVGDEKECEVCLENDGFVVEIGKQFPSGAVMPGDPHPLDRCILVAEEISS